MKLFTSLYDHMIYWSRHRHAPYYLGTLSFMESSFFPIPPDVMLAPMSLANPHRAWWYATLTTLTSVAGALFGYVLGMFFFHWISPLIVKFGYQAGYEQVRQWFDVWGGWAMFIAGVSPIPFKLFTIAGGVLAMPLFPFIVGSFIGRGLRFYLVAGLMRWGGAPMERVLRRFVEWIGWGVVVLAVIGYGVYQFI